MIDTWGQWAKLYDLFFICESADDQSAKIISGAENLQKPYIGIPDQFY